MDDDIEWTTPGNSSFSGTTYGEAELGAFFAKLAEKGFATTPQHYFADDETADGVDVFIFNADGKVIKQQSASDTAMLERVFGAQ